MLLTLSKRASFKPEVLHSALLKIGKLRCKIRAEESTHPSASLEMHVNSMLLKFLTTAVFSVHSVAKCWVDDRRCALYTRLQLPGLLLLQTGKESQTGYFASLWPFLCETRERRLKKFKLKREGNAASMPGVGGKDGVSGQVSYILARTGNHGVSRRKQQKGEKIRWRCRYKKSVQRFCFRDSNINIGMHLVHANYVVYYILYILYLHFVLYTLLVILSSYIY